MERDADDGPDVVVLRRTANGLSTVPYAERLREELAGRPATADLVVERAATPDAERELVADATVATGPSVDPAVVEEASSLRLFACVYAGTDHLPTDLLAERGVAVTNASGVHAPGIAEQVLAYLLTFARGLHRAGTRAERREWRTWHAGELKGSTVTVVGLGAIGTAVVDRLEPFGVETIGVRRSPSKGGPTDEVVGQEALHDALARTDYLVLAAPLTEATRGLIDAAAFDTLDPEAVVVNVGRGELVETDALVDALARQAIRGAALDVTDPEPLPADHRLWTFENCLVTPHMGGSTPAYWDRTTDIVADNVEHLATGGDVAGLRNLASAPE